MTHIESKWHIRNMDDFDYHYDAILRSAGNNIMPEIKEWHVNQLTMLEPTLFTLDHQVVANAVLLVKQGFHYPYDPVEVWRIGDKGVGEHPKWVTAFPKRKSTMTKKGYLEGYIRYRCELHITIPYLPFEIAFLGHG